jgi:hypothetical protein
MATLFFWVPSPIIMFIMLVIMKGVITVLFEHHHHQLDKNVKCRGEEEILKQDKNTFFERDES